MTVRRIGHQYGFKIATVTALIIIIIVAALASSFHAARGGTADDESTPTSSDSGHQDPQPSPLPSDSPDPLPPPAPPLEIPSLQAGPVIDESEELERVAHSLNAVAEVTTQIAHRADGQTEGLEGIATGFLLGHLQATALEREHLGLTQTGAVEIIGVELVSSDLGAEPPTMVVSACVDVSEIDVFDAAGNSQRDLLYDPGHPVQYIYGAEFLDEVWKLSTLDIPSTNDCAEPTRE